jgi:hypothetical protein
VDHEQARRATRLRAQLLAACPHLTILVEQVRAFADLLTNRRGADLEDGMTAVEDSDLPALHAFVRGYARTSTPSVPSCSTTCSSPRNLLAHHSVPEVAWAPVSSSVVAVEPRDEAPAGSSVPLVGRRC